jgi:hypothetical protein
MVRDFAVLCFGQAFKEKLSHPNRGTSQISGANEENRAHLSGPLSGFKPRQLSLCYPSRFVCKQGKLRGSNSGVGTDSALLRYDVTLIAK